MDETDPELQSGEMILQGKKYAMQHPCETDLIGKGKLYPQARIEEIRGYLIKKKL